MMSDEYIKRSDAEKAFCEICAWNATALCEECHHPLDFVPAADVRPVVRGRWKGDGLNDYRCSLCGHVTFGKPNFCPNCGADMRETCDGDSCPIKYDPDEFFSAERGGNHA